MVSSMTSHAPQGRLASLDAFRGATIAGMILVNNPGSWSHIYPQLGHAEWDGWTFTDWIFPFFLFIVGVAMMYSFAKRKEQGADTRKLMLTVVRRSAIIFALGIFLNGFPFFDFSTIRIPGVLQRIAVCYLIASFIALRWDMRGQVYWTIGLLVSYWVAMMLIPVPGIGAGSLAKGANLAAYIDSMVLNGHMWSVTKTWDPEGILSTVPAIATTLLGVLTGAWLRSDRSREDKTGWMFVAGMGLLLLGAILDMWMPINKNLWTSSYTIFMAGWALVCLATFYWLIDVKGYQRWAKPFVIYGMNAIAVFVLSGIVARILTLIKVAGPDGTETTLKNAIFQSVFLSIASPINASLMFAIVFVLVMYVFVWFMWKRGWFLKV
jgi:predicted acyltransferase